MMPIKLFLPTNLPQNTELFNEYHALLVRLGKEACRKQPICDRCCLFEICRFKVIMSMGLGKLNV